VEATASVKNLRTTARKARLVADEIRGKMVGDALSLLEFSIRKSVAKDLAKLVKSAVANMQSKHTEVTIDADELKITKIQVDGGPAMKRFRAIAQGRACRILKRMCHITLTISN
jgi:large subunit ribosomal protein L22